MNNHLNFTRELWPTLTGSTVDVEAIWTEVTGKVMPEFEKGHALWLLGWWRMFQVTEPPNACKNLGEYRLYVINKLNPEPPNPPTNPEPPTGRIFSDFLSQGYMSLLLPAQPEEVYSSKLQNLKNQGFKDVDIYAYNINDNPYRESKWKVDAATNPNQVVNVLKTAHQTGLRTTVWCFADELQGLSLDKAKGLLRMFIPEIDSHVDRYVLALEMNESWNSDDCKLLADQLVDLTDKDYYIHWTKGINAGTTFPRVKGIYYQYEMTSIDGVRDETKRERRKWLDANKKFIAGEFPFSVVRDDSNKAKALGNAVNDLVDGRACG
jgi:hypothetical protein